MRRKKSRHIKASIAFFIFLLHTSLGAAAELFVAPVPLGADTKPGTREKPKADVQQVIWSLKPGDTLTILPGTYTQTFSFAKSGTAEAPITVRGDASAAVILDGVALPAAGSEFSMIAVSANFLTIEGLDIRNSPGWGISVWGKTNATLRGNKITGCSQGGITASFTALTTLHDVLIEDNTLSDNCLANAEHKTLGGWPASLSVGRTRCTVRPNLVDRGHGEGLSAGGDQITIESNVVRDHFSAGIYLDNATKCVVRKNLVQHRLETPYYSGGNAPGDLTEGRSISTGCRPRSRRHGHRFVHQRLFMLPRKG